MDLNTVSAVVRPSARDQLPAWRDGDAYLAGGTWLFSEPQPQLRRLIDLARLGWPPLEVDAAGLTIAATCTIARLESLAPPKSWTVKPLVEQCCRAFLASFKIWNTATVGGNLCMALPAGPMIALATALDGVCTLWAADGGERRLAVEDFVRGPQRTALQPGEVLRAIALPAAALGRRSAFRQISLSPLGRSAALLIGTRDAAGRFALTVTAATPRPLKLGFDAVPAADDLRVAVETAVGGHWYDDIHGAPDWRRHMTLVFAEEIRTELTEPAR